MEEHEEYGTAPRSTFCVLLRSTHFQEYVSLPRRSTPGNPNWDQPPLISALCNQTRISAAEGDEDGAVLPGRNEEEV